MEDEQIQGEAPVQENSVQAEADSQGVTESEEKKKGFQPGHHIGRPKGSVSLVQILRDYIANVPVGKRKSRAVLFIEDQFRRAMKGDKTATKALWSYLEGLPQIKVDVTSGLKPIPLLELLHNNGNAEALRPEKED